MFQRNLLSDANKERPQPSGRKYPRFYETFVLIALGLIALAVLILLLIIAAMVLGLLPTVR